MAVKIITDSTSYIDGAIREELDIRIVPLHVSFEDVSMKETEVKNETFYEMMEEKGIPVSSQPSVGELYQEMETVAAAGDQVLGVFLSAEMSGTYASACKVKEMVLEQYPDAGIEIVDSRSNSMQLGFAAIVAARAAQAGKSLAEVKEITLDNIKRSRFLFIPDNLVYLKKGGRIGGASALIGHLLKIIPILTVENGTTAVLKKVRTKAKAVIAMIDKMLTDHRDYGLREIVVHHINCYDQAKELASRITAKVNMEVRICDIGPVIGLHVGPGAIGIVYYTDKKLRE